MSPTAVDAGWLDWLADEAGIDLAGAPETETNLAGTRFSARFAHVRLASAYGATTCGVWFCSDWPLRFGLLGQQDFLACYRLTLSAHEQWYELAEENG